MFACLSDACYYKSGLEEQELKEKLDIYEEGQRAVRNEAIAEAKARLEAEAEDEDFFDSSCRVARASCGRPPRRVRRCGSNTRARPTRCRRSDHMIG